VNIDGELGHTLEYFPAFVCEMAHAIVLDSDNRLARHFADSWQQKAKKLASAGSSIACSYLQSILEDERYPNAFRRGAKMILDNPPETMDKRQAWHSEGDVMLKQKLALLHYCYNNQYRDAPHVNQVLHDTARGILHELVAGLQSPNTD
jgi:hypothetical protein